MGDGLIESDDLAAFAIKRQLRDMRVKIVEGVDRYAYLKSELSRLQSDLQASVSIETPQELLDQVTRLDAAVKLMNPEARVVHTADFNEDSHSRVDTILVGTLSWGMVRLHREMTPLVGESLETVKKIVALRTEAAVLNQSTLKLRRDRKVLKSQYNCAVKFSAIEDCLMSNQGGRDLLAHLDGLDLTRILYYHQ